jgi:hypothetical protein
VTVASSFVPLIKGRIMDLLTLAPATNTYERAEVQPCTLLISIPD